MTVLGDLVFLQPAVKNNIFGLSTFYELDGFLQVALEVHGKTKSGEIVQPQS